MARRIGKAAENASIRSAERVAQRQQALENRTAYLRNEIVREELRLKRTRLRTIIVPLVAYVVAVLYFRFKSPEEWGFGAFMATVTYLACMVVYLAVRNSRRDNMKSELKRISR